MDSLRPYLKQTNIFVTNVPRSVPFITLKAYLEKIGGSNCKVVIPQDYNTKEQIGSAYLNYATVEEARRVLEKYRFAVTFNGHTCKLMLAPQKGQADKDRVFGPFSYKFQVLVKNLSETVDTPALHAFFSKYGEVYQCKTDSDHYGQYYGQVTFMDEVTVAKAVQAANGTRWDSSIISVEAHHKAHLAANVPPHPSSGGGDAPGGSSHGGAGTPRSANGHSSGGGGGVPGGRLSVFCPPDAERSGLPPMQYSAAAGVSGGGTPVNFAAQHLADGSSTAPARGQQMLGLGQFQAAAGGSGGGSRMGLNMLQSASSAEDDAAAAVTAEHMARMVLSEGSSSSLTSPAGVKAASGSDAAAAIAAAAGFGGRGGSSSNVSSGNTLFDVLARRRTIVHAPVGTPISAPAAASSASGALPSPALAHGLPPVHGGGVAARHAAAAAAFAGSGGGARRGKGVLQALSQSLEQVADLLCCPITHEPFIDPVVCADGVTYERSAIAAYLAGGHSTSPMTGVELGSLELHPNRLILSIQELL